MKRKWRWPLVGRRTYDRLDAQLARVEAQRSDLKLQLTEALNGVKSAQRRIEGFEDECGRLEGELQGAKEALEETRKDRDMLIIRFDEAINERDCALVALDRVTASKLEAEANELRYQQERDATRAQLTQSQALNRQRAEEIASLKEEVGVWRRDANDAKSEVRVLRDRNKRLNVTLATIRNAAQEALSGAKQEAGAA